jgi:sulfate/thiosulfate-binding protein
MISTTKKKISIAMISSLCLIVPTVVMAHGTPIQTTHKQTAPKTVTINFGSYSVTQGLYESAIFPAFELYWRKKTGQHVQFSASFNASGTESRNIINGLQVDVAALSLAPDITKIQKAGLITHDWTAAPYGGIITNSIVAIGVRPGNPKNIKGWNDLAAPGVIVDLPNPQTSGGAKWDINAIYGSALQNSTPSKAKQLLSSIVHNVLSLDKSGAESMSTFSKGVGDAIVTYEDEIIDARKTGTKITEVIPQSTLLIQNPIAVIDKNVALHGNSQVVNAFVSYLRSEPAQLIFAEFGFQPVDKTAYSKYASNFHNPKGIFSINYLGGWTKSDNLLYSTNGIFNQVLEGK